MAAAICAGYFGAMHSVAVIRGQFNRFGIKSIVKAGPAAIMIKFVFGLKKLGAAGRANVFALVFVVNKLAGKGYFGALIAQNTVLLGRQLGFPIYIRGSHNIFPCYLLLVQYTTNCQRYSGLF